MQSEPRHNTRPNNCPPPLWETLELIVQNPAQALREFPELIVEFAELRHVELQT